MTYETIKYESQDGILTITLNRPDKLNAFTGKMLSELLDALDRADRDDDVRAVVFTGAGRGSCRGPRLLRRRRSFGRRQHLQRREPRAGRSRPGRPSRWWRPVHLAPVRLA